MAQIDEGLKGKAYTREEVAMKISEPAVVDKDGSFIRFGLVSVKEEFASAYGLLPNQVGYYDGDDGGAIVYFWHEEEADGCFAKSLPYRAIRPANVGETLEHNLASLGA